VAPVDERDRLELLADLRTLNAELSDHGAAPLISEAAAELYPAAELGVLVTATRRHLGRIVESIA
jgi:hypothetical protein